MAIFMMFYQVKKLVLLCVVFCFCNISNAQSVSDSFNILTIMADAKPAEVKYQINATIDSPYKVLSVIPYYYSVDSAELVLLEAQNNIRNNNIQFDFYKRAGKSEYLVLHLQYGPHFSFNKHSEAICLKSISGLKVVDDIVCNTFTTTRYLIAATQFPELGSTLSPALLNRILELNEMPDTQSWQNYQALIAFLLNHVSENPEYNIVNQKGQYLSSMRHFTTRFNQVMLEKRRVSLLEYEDILKEIDDSIVNVGYKLSMSLNNISTQFTTSLPFVIEHPTYLEDFYTGISPFTLVEPESMRISLVKINDGQISFSKWPWFYKVSFSFDSSEEAFTQNNSIQVPQGTQHAFIRPYGTIGKFLRTTIQIAEMSENSDVISKVSK